MSRTYSLGEAQRLVPVLEELMTRARGAAVRAGGFESEMQDLSQRIFLSGGMHVDVAAAARRRAERDKAVEEAKATIGEVEELGVSVSDLGEGEVEIPSLLEGRTVMFCWSVGDGGIEHWREEDDAGDVRREVDGRFGRGERLQ